MRLWLAHSAWNLFCDLQGDCLGRRDTFLSCDFDLPRTRSSSVVRLGSMDSFRPSSDTSSSSAQTLGLGLNELKPVEPSGPTILIKKKKKTWVGGGIAPKSGEWLCLWLSSLYWCIGFLVVANKFIHGVDFIKEFQSLRATTMGGKRVDSRDYEIDFTKVLQV